jgi:hypothetical protein
MPCKAYNFCLGPSADRLHAPENGEFRQLRDLPDLIQTHLG